MLPPEKSQASSILRELLFDRESGSFHQRLHCVFSVCSIRAIALLQPLITSLATLTLYILQRYMRMIRTFNNTTRSSTPVQLSATTSCFCLQVIQTVIRKFIISIQRQLVVLVELRGVLRTNVDSSRRRSVVKQLLHDRANAYVIKGEQQRAERSKK